MRRPSLLIVLGVLLLCGCGDDPPPADLDAGLDASLADAGQLDAATGPPDFGPPPGPLAACDVTPPADLLRQPGRQTDGAFLAIDGRRSVAAGPSAPLEGFPSDVAIHPTLRVGYVVSSSTDDRRLQVIDLDTLAVLQDLDRGETFYGLEVSPDGTRLYVPGGHAGAVDAFTIAVDGTLTERGSVEVGGYLAGSALSPDGATLWVGDFDGAGVAELDTATLTVRRRIALMGSAWDVVFLPSRNELYVSDLRGEGVHVVDLATGTSLEKIPLPVSPAGMARRDDDGLVWVAVSGSDTVVALDTTTRSMMASAVVSPLDLLDESGAALPGSNVNALWYDATRDRLFVSLGADNAIGVWQASTLTRLGALPSDRYPTDLELAADGRTLVVVSGKGAGAGPTTDGDGAKQLLRGTVATLDLDALNLAAETAQVDRSFRRTGDLFTPDCAEFPVPTVPGRPTPLRHVILIVKENKTYDSILGDLDVPGASRDPSLTEWPETLTPNHHALAREFSHSDNFYVLTPNSDSGHLALTATHLTEYAERVWIEDNRHDEFATFPIQELSNPRGRNFFTHLLERDVSVRIYGEIVGTMLRVRGVPVSRVSDNRYPGGTFTNYSVPDEEKARYVVSQIEAGRLAQFTYLLLPNDHTNGTRPGTPTPESMVADNDFAMGLVIDALSRSSYWPYSVVFVVEDDPQGSADHIEAHRSILHVVSPWARRGYLSHVHTSYLSVFATIERILGVPPMGRGDASTAPLYDMFTTTPDYAPYDARPRIPEELNGAMALGADRSRAMDFRSPDRNPQLGTLLHMYRAFRRGELSREEAEARLDVAFAARDEELEDELEESREDTRVFDSTWAAYVAWYRETYGESPGELQLGPEAARAR